MVLFPASLIEWFQSLTKTSKCLMMQSVRPVSWSKVRVWWNWSPKMSPLSVSRGRSPWESPCMNSSKRWPTYRYFQVQQCSTVPFKWVCNNYILTFCKVCENPKRWRIYRYTGPAIFHLDECVLTTIEPFARFAKTHSHNYFLLDFKQGLDILKNCSRKPFYHLSISK